MVAANNNLSIQAVVAAGAIIRGQAHANNNMYLGAHVLAGTLITDSNSSTGPDAGTSIGEVYLTILLGLIRIGETTYWPRLWPPRINDHSVHIFIGQPQVSMPTFDYTYYRDLALGSDLVDDGSDDYYEGDTVFGSFGNTTNLTPVNGIIYVNGNVILRGEVNLYGGIIANNIKVESRLLPLSISEFHQYKTIGLDLRRNVVISLMNIEIMGRLYVEEAIVYANQDILSLSGVDWIIDINGAMVAGRDIDFFSGLGFIVYDYVSITPDRSNSDIWTKVVSWNR